MPRRNKPKHRAPRRNMSRRAARELYVSEGVKMAGRFDPENVPSSVHRVECVSGKGGYNRLDAERKLERIAADTSSNRRGSKPVRVYLCEKCGWWHLTAQSLADRHGKASG